MAIIKLDLMDYVEPFFLTRFDLSSFSLRMMGKNRFKSAYDTTAPTTANPAHAPYGVFQPELSPTYQPSRSIKSIQHMPRKHAPPAAVPPYHRNSSVSDISTASVGSRNSCSSGLYDKFEEREEDTKISIVKKPPGKIHFAQSPNRLGLRPFLPLRGIVNRLAQFHHRYSKAAGGKQYGSRQRLNMSEAPNTYDMVYFIAGGRQFCCAEWILAKHPDTLLGNPVKRKRYFSTSRRCYVFPDTLPDVFNAVLDFYEGETLTRPGRTGLRVYLEQIELFELDPKEIEGLLLREGTHSMLKTANAVLFYLKNHRLHNWLFLCPLGAVSLRTPMTCASNLFLSMNGWSKTEWSKKYDQVCNFS